MQKRNGRWLKKITINGIKYLFDEELNRLIRVVSKENKSIEIIAEFFPNLLSGKSDAFVYVLVDGKLFTLDKSSNVKNISSNTERLPIFEEVNIGQLLRIKQDIIDLFANNK